MGELKLRQDPFILEKIIDVIPYYVFWKDRNSVYLGCNQSFARWAGFEIAADVVGKTDFDCAWRSSDAEFFRSIDHQVMHSGIPILNLEEDIITSKGLERAILTSKVPLYDEFNEICGVLGIILDITERKKMEYELEKQNAMMNAIFNSFPDSLVFADKDGKIVKISQSFRESFGYSIADLYKKDISDLYSSMDECLKVKERFYGENAPGGPAAIVQNRRADGSTFTSETRVARVQSSDYETMGYLGVISDITDKLSLEDDFKKQQSLARHRAKLAAIGELAAGVGHEINNPMAIILGYLQRIEMELKKSGHDTEKMTEMIKKMERAGKRVTNIVSGLRTFSRSQTDQTTNFCISASLEETVAMVRDIYLRDGITIDMNLPKDSVWVEGNQGRIQQVFMNLIANGKDAMADCEEKRLSVTLNTSGKIAEIIVSDSGKGIPQDVQGHIFDAFFTTKDVNEGTGIGLSLVDSIVKEHHGRIHFESEEGQGTSFFIELPIVVEPEAGGSQSETSDQVPLQENFSQSLLLVDDEEDLRDVLVEILKEVGFKIEIAENGRKALEILNKRSFDIIVSDMKMPELDGPTLVEEIHRLELEKKPRIVMMTGGVNIDFEDPEHKINNKIDGYFLKPFNRDDVLKTLQKILN